MTKQQLIETIRRVIKQTLKESHPGNDQWFDAFQEAIEIMDMSDSARRFVMKSLDHVDPMSDYGDMLPAEAAKAYVDDVIGEFRAQAKDEFMQENRSATAPSKPKQSDFRKQIIAAKKMFDNGATEKEVRAKFSQEVINAVNSEAGMDELYEATTSPSKPKERPGPAVAPGKPGTGKPKPRRPLGNPDVKPAPKATMTEADMLAKIIKRFRSQQQTNEGVDDIAMGTRSFSKFQSAEELLKYTLSSLIAASQVQSWEEIDKVASDVASFLKSNSLLEGKGDKIKYHEKKVKFHQEQIKQLRSKKDK